MSLQHGDKLFVFYDDDKLPKHGRYSYFGADYGTVGGFSQYIDGYVFAVKALYNNYVSCESYRNDILDTIIYPLCFNYRQIVELYIKYMYFKYSGTDNADKENFVKRVSHRLNKAWLDVKPHLVPLLSKTGNPIDITLFDEFINEIDVFDTDSFRMRYPIKKDLTSVHAKSVKLDVIGLHSKMIELFNLFYRLDREIENVIIHNDYNDELLDNIKRIYCNNKDEIVKTSIILTELAVKEYSELENPQAHCIVDYIESDTFYNSHSSKFENYVLNLSFENAFILALLIQVGRNIVDGNCKLAVNEERKNDFYKLIEMTLLQCDSFISMNGNYSNRDMCYSLFEKGYIITSRWLNTSIEIIESCIDGSHT